MVKQTIFFQTNKSHTNTLRFRKSIFLRLFYLAFNTSDMGMKIPIEIISNGHKRVEETQSSSYSRNVKKMI